MVCKLSKYISGLMFQVCKHDKIKPVCTEDMIIEYQQEQHDIYYQIRMYIIQPRHH